MLKYYHDYSMKDCNVPCSTVLILALVVDNKTFFFLGEEAFLACALFEKLDNFTFKNYGTSFCSIFVPKSYENIY